MFSTWAAFGRLSPRHASVSGIWVTCTSLALRLAAARACNAAWRATP